MIFLIAAYNNVCFGCVKEILLVFRRFYAPNKYDNNRFWGLCLGYICLTTTIRCPYDVQITVSVRPPQADLAIIVRIYGHRGLYDFV